MPYLAVSHAYALSHVELEDRDVFVLKQPTDEPVFMIVFYQENAQFPSYNF